MKNQEEMRVTNFFTVYHSVYPGSRIILLDLLIKPHMSFSFSARLIIILSHFTIPLYHKIFKISNHLPFAIVQNPYALSHISLFKMPSQTSKFFCPLDRNHFSKGTVI